ncbi:E3 ubiquitin-protein ligase RNF103-like [Lytechinus pictus]|uniref:E3 ubiquitin-protein ligase RNF103-like n=1 Tax=Lytechinus pictus TaxID=7653 RepID=UPI0030B9C9BD
MEMFMKKIIFLLVYAMLLFLLARLLEYIAWYETGLLMMKLVDPVSLSVRKLKSLLDGRGLSYEGVIDKAELTQLVEESGQVMEGEVLMMEKDVSDVEEEETTSTAFTGYTQFYEEVEDKKDSIWLVQVIPGNHGPLLGKRAWSTVVKKLSRFGIRHGTFDCSIDPRICPQKNWNQPLLLLAMPQAHRHKGEVSMAMFTSAGKAQQIINWVYLELAHRVNTERRIGQEFDWDRVESDQDYAVKIVLFSRNHEPPLFFSALNLKYSGRVKFVFVSDSKTFYVFDNQAQKYWLPSYVIITPEGKNIYGTHIGEYCTYTALDIYLQTLAPEANDIFVLTFINVNAICFIGLFVIQGGIAKRICSFLLTIGKYNITFLLLWLPLLGIIQLPFMASVQDYLYKILRLSSQTWLMGKLCQDWIMYSGHSYIIIGSFLLYCVAVNWVSKRINAPRHEDDMTSAMWLRSSLVDFRSFLLRPSPSLRNSLPRHDHREEGLDLLIEQMAVPDLWLHPRIPENYMNDLLTWRYSCDWLQNYSSGNDSSDSEKGACRSHTKKCAELRQCLLKCGLKCRNDSNPCSYSPKMERKDFGTNKRNGEDDLFVVEGQEKPCCKQPESITWSDSEHETRFFTGSTSKVLKGSSVDRLEAELDGARSDLGEKPLTKADSNFNHEKCSFGERQVCPQPVKETNMETPEFCAESLKEKDKEKPNLALASRKHSPRHCAEVKPKTSPRKKRPQTTKSWPEGVLFDAQCAICIDAYTTGVMLCGLPCGHAYHQQCIFAWLNNGNHVCPICRWPAYKKKAKSSKHME